MKKSPFGVCGVLVTWLLVSSTGCNTTDKTAAQKGQEDEYVYVTVTGSNIPKKIKKSDIAAGKVPKDVDMQLVDKEGFAKGLRPGVSKGN